MAGTRAAAFGGPLLHPLGGKTAFAQTLPRRIVKAALLFASPILL